MVYVCWFVGEAVNHLSSSFYMQRCHSPLQIKPSCFREIMAWLCDLFQEGGIQIWSLFAIFIVKFLSPAVLHFLYVFFFSWSSCENWIGNNEAPPSNFPHYVVFVLMHSVCLLLVKRQLHNMMLRSMRGLGGIIFSHSSQQSYSFPHCTK